MKPPRRQAGFRIWAGLNFQVASAPVLSYGARQGTRNSQERHAWIMTDRTRYHPARTLALAPLVLMAAACDRPPPSAIGTVAAAPEAGFLRGDTPDDPALFARALFDDDGTTGAVPANGDLRERYFTPELAGLLADTVRDDPTKLQSDPLCLCTSPTALKQRIAIAWPDRDHALARVTVTRQGVSDGATARLVLVMARGPEGWHVADVRYPESGESLRQILAKANGDDLQLRAPD